jgi:hypothetical protein
VLQLLQRCVDRVKGGAEFATDAVDRSDDHKRNASSNHAALRNVLELAGSGILLDGSQQKLDYGFTPPTAGADALCDPNWRRDMALYEVVFLYSRMCCKNASTSSSGECAVGWEF